MHRQAQFLIYKVLEKADYLRKPYPCVRIRILKLKVKIGRGALEAKDFLRCHSSWGLFSWTSHGSGENTEANDD